VRKAYGDLVIFKDLNLHIERGDRIALVGPNGVGKSTLMRMLSGVEAPDSGTRTEGHQVVTQYFAQDEATRLDPTLNIYQTLAGDAPLHMVPSIRNILGGFLFSGDDVDKPVRVLSGGERTRLAVARMLLRPSNTLLLDEPTNHLDLDSKDVLLDALEDFGGTLIFVSHDRYFVERLATKIIEVGNGTALIYPGTYREFLWHKQEVGGQRPEARTLGTQPRAKSPEPKGGGPAAKPQAQAGGAAPKPRSSEGGPKPLDKARGEGGKPDARSPESGARGHEEKKRLDAEARKVAKAVQARKSRIDTLESRIAETENAIRALEQQMSAPGFYDDRAASQPVIDQHQALMWKVGELMQQWEELQTLDDPATSSAQ
jgi:ATP-binding cassette subfamily F protein 3